MPLTFKPAVPATRFAKVLLIGEAGTGKSHAALTFPKPAVIDAEGSADWFADRFTFSSVNTKSYSDVKELLDSIRAGKVDCETVVIDSLTTIYNGLLMAIAGNKDDIAPRDWGKIKRKFSSMLDEMYHKTNKHVVCIGWIKPTYAKQGTIVNGERVKANELQTIGEQFDGDKKTEHAFDFIFKIEGNDGKRTRATVLKSRSGQLVKGQTIENFSFETLKPLLPNGAQIAQGMSDEEQIAQDAALADEPPPPPRGKAPTATIPEFIALYQQKGHPGGSPTAYAQKVLNVTKNTMSQEETAIVCAALRELPDAPQQMAPASAIDAAGDAPPGQAEVPSGADHPAGVRGKPSEAQKRLYFALASELGYDDKRRHELNKLQTGKESWTEFDADDASKVIDVLQKRIDMKNQAAQTA